MQTEKRQEIDAGVGFYVQKLSWEMEGYRVLCCQLARTGEADETARKELLDRYSNAYAEHRVSMDELICKTMPELVDGKTKFHLDFANMELVAQREET